MNTTDPRKEVFAYFARGEFWEGIQAYCNLRKEFILNDALGAPNWEAVNAAKGQSAEIFKLRSLQIEVEKFIADQQGSKNISK